jgi:uncharacterized protein YdeI (YjbR/CyaY-like superfamily)
MIEDVEEYFVRGCGRCARFDTPDCSTRQWASGLHALRRVCRETGLFETVKWAHPCYMHAGRNIAVIGALRGDFRLGFMNAALMKDAEGILERQGPNTRHAGTIRFTTEERVEALRPVIVAYLRESMGYAEAGIKPVTVASEIDLPGELIEAMDADPELAEAFHNLTPGRQRSYAILLGSAKTPATRVARIARSRGRILAGKGATER